MLSGDDWNLMPKLEVLLAERHVTRAAEKLGVGQPAMSQVLRRAREVLKDPLIVRTRQGWTLTPRAQALLPHLKAAREALTAGLTPPEPFSPATVRRTFTMAGADFHELVLMPPLLKRLETEAPGVDVMSRRRMMELPQCLENGEADLWMGILPPDVPGLYTRPVLTEHHLCAVRRGNPVAGKKLTVKQFAALRHIQIAPGETAGGPLDDLLARQGLERRVVARVPHFLLAPLLVAETDLILTAPSRLLALFEDALDLVIFPPPVKLEGFTLVQVWHARSHHDPAHKWFRDTVRAVMQEQQATRPRKVRSGRRA